MLGVRSTPGVLTSASGCSKAGRGVVLEEVAGAGVDDERRAVGARADIEVEGLAGGATAGSTAGPPQQPQPSTASRPRRRELQAITSP